MALFRWPKGTPVEPDGHGPGGGRFRSPGGWAEAVSGAIGKAVRYLSHAQVKGHLGHPHEKFRPDAAGGQGAIEFRQYRDGTKLVHKEFYGANPATEVDREVEASLIAHAIGVPTPAAVADYSDIYHPAVLMQYIEGVELRPRDIPGPGMQETVEERYQRVARALAGQGAADGGESARLVALLDGVILNPDRHHLNVIVLDDGTVVAIDHGMALGELAFQLGAGDIEDIARRATRHVPLLHQQAVVRPPKPGVKVIHSGRPAMEWRQEYFTRESLQAARERVAALGDQIRPNMLAGVLRNLDAIIAVTTSRAKHHLRGPLT